MFFKIFISIALAYEPLTATKETIIVSDAIKDKQYIGQYYHKIAIFYKWPKTPAYKNNKELLFEQVYKGCTIIIKTDHSLIIKDFILIGDSCYKLFL